MDEDARELMNEPSAWRELREELEAEGVRPTKTLGQNFLFDPNLARAIVRDAGVESGDRVLEVGPGCGFLTQPLADAGVELLSVEIDERLLRIARRRVGERANVRFLNTDVLEGKSALALSVREALWTTGDWHLVANLPYGISGPLVAVLASGANPPRSMTILVQTEVAERLAAQPGSRIWGALSARVQLRYDASLGRVVGAQLFWPRPRVESRIARLVLRPVADAPSATAFERVDFLIGGVFQRRRKTLLAGLGALVGDRERAARALGAAGIDPRARPEALGADDFVRLAEAIGPLVGESSADSAPEG